MKALAYHAAHALKDFALAEVELPMPSLQDGDVLVRVRAISVNPVDTKVRASRSGAAGRPVILGWDVAGVIEKVGPAVTGWQAGDEVFYAGALMRDGGNAEYQAVDHRVLAPKPKNLTFAEAAALPLTSITAWEAVLEGEIGNYTKASKVLIIGGAGGVGSIATQLLKAAKGADAPRVFVTASRPETREWCERMGADVILNHRNDLAEELKAHGAEPGTLDVVFGTTHSKHYLKVIPDLLHAFGHFCLIDDPDVLDVVGFKRKAIRVHWEYMFAKTFWGYRPESQGAILREVSKLVEAGKVKTTANLFLKGLTVENLRKAHALLEAAESVGKIVIEVG